MHRGELFMDFQVIRPNFTLGHFTLRNFGVKFPGESPMRPPTAIFGAEAPPSASLLEVSMEEAPSTTLPAEQAQEEELAVHFKKLAQALQGRKASPRPNSRSGSCVGVAPSTALYLN